MTNELDRTAENAQPQEQGHRDYRFVTLRIAPALHTEVQKMTARLQYTTEKRVSVNALITRYIKEGLKRETNPKMLKDFEGL